VATADRRDPLTGTSPATVAAAPDRVVVRLLKGLGRWLLRLGPPLLYTALALLVFRPLLVSPRTRLFIGAGGSDQVAAQWFLAHTAQALAHLRNPFVTDLLNVPTGVNLAAQASMVGVGAPLAPLTLLVGVQVSYTVVLVASLAGTATAWYWLLWAKLRLHWLAATVAAAYCGFNPHLIPETAGRNHVALQVLVPVIIWHVVRLGEPDHPLRRGIVLGVLVAWQALIGEEVLLLTALGLAVFGIVYVAQRPGLLRRAGARYARGLGIAVATALVLLAYPLGMQFFGPGRVDGFPINLSGEVTRWPMWLGLHAAYPVLGLPLAAVLLGTLAMLWRHPVVPACAVVLLFFALASFGQRMDLGALGTFAGPWSLVDAAPVAEVVVPERLALGAVAAGAVLLAYGLDALLRTALPVRGEDAAHRRVGAARRWSAAGALLVASALLAVSVVQLWPAGPPVWTPSRVPRFITSAGWRPYVAGGRSVVSVPLAGSFWFDGQRWAVSTNVRFAIPRGYFVGPGPGGVGTIWGAPPRWTSTYLDDTAMSGRPPARQPGDAERFRADLRYWRAGVLVLAADQVNVAALRAAVTRFLGPPRSAQGAWIWDTRTLA
jgi:hypothetical protein